MLTAVSTVNYVVVGVQILDVDVGGIRAQAGSASVNQNAWPVVRSVRARIRMLLSKFRHHLRMTRSITSKPGDGALPTSLTNHLSSSIIAQNAESRGRKHKMAGQ